MDIYDRIQTTGEKFGVPRAFLRTGISQHQPFPDSYVQFIERFGYGLTCDLFLIYPPLGNYCDSFHVQSLNIKSALLQVLRLDDPSYRFQLEPDGSEELIGNLVAFARSENSEQLYWDTSRFENREYPIYLGGRPGIYHAGRDLRDFIQRVTDPASFKKIMVFSTEPLPLTFRSVDRTHWDAHRKAHP
jgi:hypothetical protein